MGMLDSADEVTERVMLMEVDCDCDAPLDKEAVLVTDSDDVTEADRADVLDRDAEVGRDMDAVREGVPDGGGDDRDVVRVRDGLVKKDGDAVGGKERVPEAD